MFMQSPNHVYDWIKKKISTDVEEIWVLALSASCQLIQGEMIYRGTVDQCLCHPREIFRFVIVNRASTFILVHNHPSGSLEPSLEDLENTQRLILVAKLVEIPLTDHLIVSKDGYMSLKQRYRESFS